MKTITLPKDWEADEGAIDVLKMVTSVSQTGGMTMKEMRARNRVMDVLEKVKGGTLTFEDADYEKLKALFSDFKFPFVSKDLMALQDCVDNPGEPDDG